MPPLQDMYRERDALVRRLRQLDGEIECASSRPMNARDQATVDLRQYSRERVGPAFDDAIFEALQPRDGA